MKNDTDLTTDDLKELVRNFKAAVKKQTGEDFPSMSVGSALGRRLRRIRFVDERPRHPLPQAQQHPRRMGNGRIGTGHGIRQHGFSNSATGVAFSRDAATGENLFNGEYLINAQGEDVVAGIRTPQQITLEGFEALGGRPERLRGGPPARNSPRSKR